MIPFEKAKEIALDLLPEANNYQETTTAWIFGDDTNISFGHNEPVVVLKETGEAIPMVEFLFGDYDQCNKIGSGRI